MSAYDSRFQSVLAASLTQTISERGQKIWRSPVADFESFRHAVGYIQGVEFALGEIERVRAELARPEKEVNVPADVKTRVTYET